MDMMDQFSKRIPEILLSRVDAFGTIAYRSIKVKVHEMLPDSFTEDSTEFQNGLSKLWIYIDDMLTKALERATDDIQDVITVGTISCHDWMIKTAKSKKS